MLWGIWKRKTLIELDEAETWEVNWISWVRKGQNNSGNKTIKGKNHRGMNHIQEMLMIKSGWLEHAIYTLNKHTVLDCKGFSILHLEICFFSYTQILRKTTTK